MNGADVLADTNAVIAWIKQDRDLARGLLTWSAPAISGFTLGELLFGAIKSTHPDRNRSLIQSAKESFILLFADEGTSEIYATVRHALRRKGRPIPENDIWIAALAIQHGLPLLTRDKHFHEVEGLHVIAW
jgi:tRNA(fMet)-specific endonuclease VapC